MESRATVRKVFENGEVRPIVELEIIQSGGFWTNERKVSFRISKRIWEEMGKTMQWKK